MTDDTKRYFGWWDCYEQMLDNFSGYGGEKNAIKDMPPDSDILFASYGGGSYEGDAIVVFGQGGKLYEVHGSHCSCYGLEDQWAPEETTWAALAMREKKDKGKYYHFLSDHDDEAYEAYWKLVADAHTQSPTR